MVSRGLLLCLSLVALTAQAKTFQNSYVAFEVPDDWTCLQEGVAWTCTPRDPVAAKEAVIVLAAKVAGPEDSLNNFYSFLKQPKKIITKVGTPMPSSVMYVKKVPLGTHEWIQSQHLGSEIQDYYTLYLATVKDKLAILVSFSSEKDRFKIYNPIFDKAIRTLRIVANNQLLFPKANSDSPSALIGIQGPESQVNPLLTDDPTLIARNKRMGVKKLSALALILIAIASLGYYVLARRRQKDTPRKTAKVKPK